MADQDPKPRSSQLDAPRRGRRKRGLRERLDRAVQNVLDALKDLVEPSFTPVPVPVHGSRRRYRR